MKIEKGQYVVANINDKDCLIRVEHVSKDIVEGYHEHGEEEERVQFEIEQVQATLSDNPQPGRVYGATTERLVELTECEGISVKWFFKPSSHHTKTIHKAIKKTLSILEENGLEYTADWFDVKVVYNRAKRLTAKSIIGTYQVKAGEEKDVLTVKYHPDVEPQLIRLFIHEIGHGVWARKLPVKAQQRWLEHFICLTDNPTVIENDEVLEVLADVLEEGEMTSKKENASQILDEIYGAVSAMYAVKPRELDLLLLQESKVAHAMLKNVTQSMTISYVEEERDSHVSEYANTNGQEMFCEWMANHFTGIVTPKSLKKLADKTIDTICK